MKRIYSLYVTGFVLVVAGGILLANPPTTAFACTGSASCQYGESVSIPMGATSCSCTDNVECTWTRNGQTYSQKCAAKGDDEMFEIEEGPVN